METAQLPMKLELPDSLKEACPDAVKLPPGETVTDAEAGSALAAVIAIATIAFANILFISISSLGFSASETWLAPARSATRSKRGRAAGT